MGFERVYDYSDAPTIRRFNESKKFYRLLSGPFGSGKSSGCIAEIVDIGMNQVPNKEGVRKTRWAVVRNTYKVLLDTTMATFFYWLPPEHFGDYNVTNFQYTINKIELSDGTKVEIDIRFRALDKEEQLRNLLSLELTGAWFNELREIPKIISDTMEGRVNRFPSKEEGGPTWTGIIADTNPPDTDSWIYKFYEEKLPNDPELASRYEMFKQPSGRSDNAENLRHLPGGKKYYTDLAIGKDPEYVKVYIDGEYGYLRDGKPVYPNYSDTLHLAPEPIKPVKGYPILVGMDFALNPAAALCQYLPTGKFHVLHELIGSDMGLRRFITEMLKPYILSTLSGYELIIIGDPAGIRRNDTDERSCFDELRAAGFPATPAPTNAFLARYNAVDSLLTKLIEGKAAFQLSPACKVLHKGFLGEYKLKKFKMLDDQYSEVPVKNMYCVDESTEMLTNHGWKKYNEINKNDTAFGINLKTQKLEETKIKNINIFNGNFQVRNFSGATTNFMFTDEHNCVVRKRHTRGNKWDKMHIEKCKNINTSHAFISSAPLDEFDKRKKFFYSDWFVRVCSWIAAEGTYRNDGSILIFQSKTHNPEYVKAIDELLIGHPCLSSRLEHKNGTMVSWRIVNELSEMIKLVMPLKIPTYDFIMKMRNSQKRLFLYEYIRGDGSYGRGSYGPMPTKTRILRNREFYLNRDITPRIYSASEAMVDALQCAAILSGLNVRKSLSGERYALTFIKKTNKISIVNMEVSTKSVDMVWCPTTELGTWVMRRDGNVLLTGNSHIHDALEYACLMADNSAIITRTRQYMGSRYNNPSKKTSDRSIRAWY